MPPQTVSLLIPIVPRLIASYVVVGIMYWADEWLGEVFCLMFHWIQTNSEDITEYCLGIYVWDHLLRSRMRDEFIEYATVRANPRSHNKVAKSISNKKNN